MNQSTFASLPEHQSVSSPDHDSQNTASLNSDSELCRVTRSIASVEAATYHWDLTTDEIIWHGKTADIFNRIDPVKYAHGRAYASLLDPDNFTSRFETVMNNHQRDNGSGVPFAIEYSIKPHGRDQEPSIRIEDTGRWYADHDGNPSEVYGIVRQIDDRKKQDQHLQFLGNCDPLTGMMNRGRLAEVLDDTIRLTRTEKYTCGFLTVSISNLAIVNEAYGFGIADDVISKIGNRLREVIRGEDFIGRCSGSKFGIIMSRATEDELKIAAERFLSIARQRVIETEMGPVWAMLSIGGVLLPNNEEDANLTMAHAEEALTEAKRRATDSVVIFKPSQDLLSERKLNSRCAVEVVHSLKENQFTLAFQPVVNANTKEVAFHEALLRMRSDNGDVVTAGHLIPIAEKLGLIRLIDQVVIYRVLSVLRQFPKAKIALNISGVTANDPRWFGKLTELLEENTDITNRLTIEITETVALQDIDQTVSFIEKLHTLGCKVAIDDFGAGFTSFKNLKVLNVDKVKIDGSFCQDLSNNENNQYFVHTLIDLSKKFNLEVVAEWVENEDDAALLTSWGVDYLQGQLYGMAESESQWGEPINETEEICVIPSEFLFDEPEDVAEDLVTTNSRQDYETPEPGMILESHLPEITVPDAEPAEQAPEQALGQSPEQQAEIEAIPASITSFDQENPVAEISDNIPADQSQAELSPLQLELQKLRGFIEQLNDQKVSTQDKNLNPTKRDEL